MSQQFEYALEYSLSNIQPHYIDIIHMAVALYYYGVLNLHTADYEIIGFKDKPALPAVNFALILSQYVKHISQARINTAVNYGVIIQDPIQKKQFLEQLALDTREYQVLFGEKSGSGTNRGILFYFLPEQDVKEIIAFTANELEKESRFSDAIIIFDLIDEYSEVFRILINHLGKNLLPNPTNERDRRILISFTDQIFISYTQSGIIQSIDPRKKTTLQMLCSLICFFLIYITLRNMLRHLSS